MPAQQYAHQREAKIEDFLDRQRPQHIPACRQIAGVCFIPVQIKPECRTHRSMQRLSRTPDRIILRTQKVQRREDRDQCHQAWQNARRTPHIESPQLDCTQAAPAHERVRRNQESGDHEEDIDRFRSVEVQIVEELTRQMRAKYPLRQSNPKANVIQQNEKNRKPAQKIDPRIARGCTRLVRNLLGQQGTPEAAAMLVPFS